MIKSTGCSLHTVRYEEQVGKTLYAWEIFSDVLQSIYDTLELPLMVQCNLEYRVLIS